MSLKQTLIDNSNYPPLEDNGGIKGYLANFANDTGYDDMVTQYANDVTADQSDLKFTGYTKDRDYLLEDASDFGYDDLIEFKAQNQSNWAKRGRGLARLGFKTAMNILEMPGIAFGAAEAAMTGDPYALINNGWSNAIKSANEWFDEEVAPVYVKKAVRDGNLWDNIKSVDFWATEGADGLAFALSALVPGAAVKGLKLGSKVANGLAKSKGAKYLQKVDDKISKMMNTGGVADTTDIAAATAFNTIYEAGMEAQMGMDSYKTKLADMFANNEITQDDYAALSDKTGSVGANIFAANAALLLGPNAMMSKSLFGKAMPKKQLGKFKRVDGKYVPEANQLSKKQKALKGIKDGAALIGKSTVSEGFVEEAGQMVAEKFNVEGTIQDYLGEESKSLTELYADVVNSTEGQKAIMLGGVFGTGMTAVGDIKNRKPTKERNQNLADMMSRGANLMDVSINGVYKTDEQGNIEFDKGKPVVDQAKLANFGSEMEFVESINNAKEDIVEQVSKGEMTISEAAANTEMLDETLRKQALLSFVHAQDEGLEVLENYLENGSGIESLYAAELETNPEFDIKGAKQKLKGELIAEATSLQKDLKYAQDYMHFDNQLDVKQSDPHYGQYMSKLHQDYTIANSNVRLAQSKINELNSAKDKYQVVDYETLDNKGLFMDNIDREIATYERTKEALETKIKSYVDPAVQKKAYEAYSKQQTELENVNEEAKDLDKTLTDIDNATSRTEVEEVIATSGLTTPVKKEAIEKKRVEKEKMFDTQRAKVAKKINEDAEKEEVINVAAQIAHNDALDYIRDNFNEGEIIPLPEDIDTDMPLESYLQITKFNQDGSIAFLDVDTNLIEIFIPKVIKSTIVEAIPTETEGVELVNSDIINEETVKKTDTSVETDPKIASAGVGTSEGYLEYFQLNGQDKKGTPVQFAILDPGGITKDTPAFVRDMITKSKKAIDIYNQLLAGKALTEAQEDLFTGYFPLQVNVTGTNHSSFIHAEFRNNKSKPEQKIRRQILNVLKAEVAKGNPVKITDLSTTILNQGKGKLSLEEKKGVYNSLNDLKNIQDQGGLENLEFGILNDVGILVNPYDKESIKGSTVFNPDWRGAVFVMINRDSTGEKFPLHVNISRISEQHASSLYDLGLDVINNSTVTNNTRLSDMDNFDRYSTEFAEELELMVNLGKRTVDEITVNDLTRFMYFTGSASPKSKLQINNDSLVFGSTEIKAGEEVTSLDKDEFVDWVTNNKNRNINGKSLSNSKYRKYIIDNKVLFSNAKANVPLFSQDTDLFLDVNVKYNKPTQQPTQQSGAVTKNNEDSTRNSQEKVVTLQKQTKKEVTTKRKKKTKKFKSGLSGITVPGVKNTTAETTTNSSTPVPGEQTTSTEKPEEICNGDGEVMGSMSTSLKGAKPAKPSNRFNKFKK